MEKLAEKGYAIAFPERLTLEQQIYLINKHETIIGVMGSAFHGALFDLSPEACRNVVYLTEKISSANNSRILTFIIIDILKSLNSTYISAIDGTEYPWKARVESAAIDLETTLRGLRELDLL